MPNEDLEQVQEEVTEDVEGTHEQVVEEDATALELAEIKSQVSNLFASQNRILEALTPKQRDDLTDEQVQELAKDPKKLIQTINAMVDTKVKQVTTTTQQREIDRKLQEEYPAIRTDPKFRNAVVAQMKEFIANGEYSEDHPMLTLRAAQLVAGKMNVSGKKEHVIQRATPSAAAPNQVRQSTVKPKISDNDPRVVMAREMGLDEKSIATFKGTLDAYQAPERARGKTLLRRK